MEYVRICNRCCDRRGDDRLDPRNGSQTWADRVALVPCDNLRLEPSDPRLSIFDLVQALALDQTEPGRMPTQSIDEHVRWRISKSRARCIISADCCSAVFTGTKRIDGRRTASQISAMKS